MTAQQQSEKSIFLQAIDIGTPEQRVAFLAEACGSNDHLRAEIDALLCAHGQSHGLLDAPNVTVDQSISERPGTVIGPYKLLEQIGEGGMGVVFMAEQFRPIQRKVALKIIKPGMDTKQVVARFEAERQALALMDHPNIARVLDAGATESGRPYFVMELVRGVPINEYCDAHRLSIRERLELFATVCQAVQHAHQKGIIHRDLKPSNILVTQHDGKPLVKVIDFGVAKATGQKLTDKTLFTGFAQLVGTPLYMSPEQAEMSEPDVDTRSDIYSLGVLLYELLTGHTPFDSQRLKAAAFDEFCRIIREEEPPRPSTRFSSLSLRERAGVRVPDEQSDQNAEVRETAKLASTIAEQRRVSDPRHLSKLFQGELDWIVMKSLEKDRNRRYETASAIAADVERYLRDEPVQACPPSAVYRIRKMIRRHRAAILAGAGLGLMLLIVVGAIAGSIGWVARDKATRQAALNLQVSQALKDVESFHEAGKLTEAVTALKRAEGILSGDETQEISQRIAQWRADLETVRRLENIRLDEALPRIIKRMPTEPLHSDDESDGPHVEEWNFVSADESYRKEFQNYGLNPDSIDLASAAQHIQKSPIKQELVASLDDWVHVIQPSRDKDSALKVKLLQLARSADPDPWRNRLRNAILQNDVAEVSGLAGDEEIMKQPLATVMLLVRVLQHRDGGDSSLDGARILGQVQRLHPNDFWVNFELANCLPASERADEIGYRRVAVALRPDSLGARFALANCLVDQGKDTEAEGIFREIALHSPDDPSFYYDLGDLLRRRGNPVEAEASFRKAIQLAPNDYIGHLLLGRALRDQKKTTEAIAEYQETIRLAPNNGWPHRDLAGIYSSKRDYAKTETESREAVLLNPKNADWYCQLADCLVQEKKYAEAEKAAREAIRINPGHARAHMFLASALVRPDQQSQAEDEFREAIHLSPLDHLPLKPYAAFLGRLGRLAEQEAALRERIRLTPNNPHTHQELAESLQVQGRNEEAETEFREAIRVGPTDQLSRRKYSAFLGKLGRIAEQEAVLREELQLVPKDSIAHTDLGDALDGQGKSAEAEAEFRAAIQLDPMNSAAYRRLSNQYLKLGRPVEAETVCREAIRMNAIISETYRYLGDSLQQQNRTDEAEAAFREAIRIDPKSAVEHRHLGNLLLNMGRYAEAEPEIREGIRLEPKNKNGLNDLEELQKKLTEASSDGAPKSAPEPKPVNSPTRSESNENSNEQNLHLEVKRSESTRPADQKEQSTQRN